MGKANRSSSVSPWWLLGVVKSPRAAALSDRGKEGTAISFPSGERVSEGAVDPINVLAVELGSKSPGDVAKRNPLSLSPSRPVMGDIGERGRVMIGVGFVKKVSMIHCFSA